MLRICISGKAKSGKNTTAEIIASELKLLHSEYLITSFAKKIKETVISLFPGCDPASLYGASELREIRIDSNTSYAGSPTYREACIAVGKMGRSFHPNFWIGHIINEIDSLSKDIKCLIISDQRFADELAWAKDNDFFLIRVKRNDHEKRINDMSEEGQDLISDAQYHYIIENNGSKEDLRKEVRKLISTLKLT